MKIPVSAIHDAGDDIRTVPPGAAAEAELAASVRAVGVISPILVREAGPGEGYFIVAGRRRLRAARAAELEEIPAEIFTGDPADITAVQAAENMARAAMHPIDTWRVMAALQEQGKSLQACADMLGIELRVAKRLDQLSRIHPPMLEAMAELGLPPQHQLATIASAPLEKQAAAWERHQATVGPADDDEDETSWWNVANALQLKRRFKADASFGDDIAEEFGVVWEEDLFCPPGDREAISTLKTVEFDQAQRAWVERALIPELAARGISARWIGTDKNKSPNLPKDAERTYGDPEKAPKTLIRGYYLQPYEGAVGCALFKLPKAAKQQPTESAAKPGKKAKSEAATQAEALAAGQSPAPEQPPAPETSRPPISRGGLAEIAARQTAALREDLRERATTCSEIPDARRLLACMLLLLSAGNVQVQGDERYRHADFEDLVMRLLAPNGTLNPEVLASVELERLVLLALARSLVMRTEGYHPGSGAAFGRIACAIGSTYPRCDDAEFLERFVTGAEMRRLAETVGVPAKGKVAELAHALAGKLHPTWSPAMWNREPPAEGVEPNDDLQALETPAPPAGPTDPIADAMAKTMQAPTPATAEVTLKISPGATATELRDVLALLQEHIDGKRTHPHIASSHVLVMIPEGLALGALRTAAQEITAAIAEAERPPQVCRWDGTHECPIEQSPFCRNQCPRAEEYDRWWDSGASRALPPSAPAEEPAPPVTKPKRGGGKKKTSPPQEASA